MFNYSFVITHNNNNNEKDDDDDTNIVIIIITIIIVNAIIIIMESLFLDQSLTRGPLQKQCLFYIYFLNYFFSLLFVYFSLFFQTILKLLLNYFTPIILKQKIVWLASHNYCIDSFKIALKQKKCVCNLMIKQD